MVTKKKLTINKIILADLNYVQMQLNEKVCATHVKKVSQVPFSVSIKRAFVLHTKMNVKLYSWGLISR